MSDEDAKRFYKFLLDYPDIRYKTAMLLFLLMGFRRGEVAGLEWKDVDFEKREITVCRSVTTINGYCVIEKEPKTEASLSEYLYGVVKQNAARSEYGPLFVAQFTAHEYHVILPQAFLSLPFR